ncbi:carbon-nitrogen family hydrolase [Halalkalibacter hemicellulosilyticus]|uniref:Aliphatic amidase amiE n=1 Tax=Halalkalibacter hemicellulosilyticusJCM 9152 TaxID=1236971 RepID=W4QGQ3_9BACI|nr:carbon-nitrogen family hydrolase [Halalkalibacter hemicellulosilyticus]GAE31097.1 aliphatic amidase amiE [Halalkalibacter hemicellulosilyticusJCM 9152]
MKVAIYQMDIIAGEIEQNRQKVANWAEEVCTGESMDLLVLPEMWTTAYTLPQLQQLIGENNDEMESFLVGLAQKYEVNVIAGSIVVKEKGHFYNRVLVYSRQGELAYHYDKIHLVPMLKEDDYLTGGQNKAEVFELDGRKIGVIICYDLRFPELARSLALEGAEMLVVVAEWPLARELHWNTLLRARAIENQLYVVSSNRVGAYDGVEFAGQSQVINPWGEVVAKGSIEKEETLFTSLDLEEVQRIRQDVPVFKSRVPSLYK